MSAYLLSYICMHLILFSQLFPYDEFQQQTRKQMVTKVMAIFHKYPSFVVTFKVICKTALLFSLCSFPYLLFVLQELILDVIRDGTHPNRKELIITLCWIVGEYTSSSITPFCTPKVITEYHEALETFAFEKISLAKMEQSEAQFNLAPSSNTPLRSSLLRNLTGAGGSDDLFSTRLMIILISSLAKLAARWQDLVAFPLSLSLLFAHTLTCTTHTH